MVINLRKYSFKDDSDGDIVCDTEIIGTDDGYNNEEILYSLSMNSTDSDLIVSSSLSE